MLSLLGFGKRRRSRRSTKKSSKKGSKTPPKQLLKIAKRLGLKVTVKRGSRRVYKSKTLIKRAVVKKLRMIKKKKLAQKKKLSKRKGSKFGKRRVRRSRRSRIGMKKPSAPMMQMYFGRLY